MFLKSKGFLRNTGHWKKHGFETFSGFEKQDNIARWSARNRRATKVIFFKICAHYRKNSPLRAHRVGFMEVDRRAEKQSPKCPAIGSEDAFREPRGGPKTAP